MHLNIKSLMIMNNSTCSNTEDLCMKYYVNITHILRNNDKAILCYLYQDFCLFFEMKANMIFFCQVLRVEQTGLGTVFMCTHSGTRYGNTGCRRTYLSQVSHQ